MSRPYHTKSFREIWWTFYQENILSSGFFRRETASGFFPWGKVDSPRERVAEGLCGWRHGNSFPMTQSAQSHRQMRSIPLCSKAVFYVFVFGSIHNSATLHNLSPGIFHWTPITLYCPRLYFMFLHLVAKAHIWDNENGGCPFLSWKRRASIFVVLLQFYIHMRPINSTT